MKRILALVLTLLMSLSLVACGNAKDDTSDGAETDNYPEKPITVIVPFSAGGEHDLTARTIATRLHDMFGWTVVIQNTSGDSAATIEYMKDSGNADGYTLFMHSPEVMASGFVSGQLNEDYYKQFTYLGCFVYDPLCISVAADSPFNTIEELFAYAKEHPGEIQVGNSGTGSIWHIAAASIEKECGVEFTHVPFDGAAPAVAALLGNNIQAVTVSPSEVKNNVDAGDFKVLCILGEGRSSVVPEVETAQEMGYDITIQGWGGFAVPKDTPQAIVDILEEASEVAINSDSVKQTLADRGYEHAYLNGADMDAKAAEELAYYSELIPELGIA